MVGVFDAGTLVGCAMPLVVGPQAYVDYFYIHPMFQREGLGIDLARYVVQSLKKQGVKILHACVSGENYAMQNMLKTFKPKIGWPYTNIVIDLREKQNG